MRRTKLCVATATAAVALGAAAECASGATVYRTAGGTRQVGSVTYLPHANRYIVYSYTSGRSTSIGAIALSDERWQVYRPAFQGQLVGYVTHSSPTLYRVWSGKPTSSHLVGHVTASADRWNVYQPVTGLPFTRVGYVTRPSTGEGAGGAALLLLLG